MNRATLNRHEQIASSNASTADPTGLRTYFGGSSEANADRTVFRETFNVLAINLIGNPSARCNLRISAQSSTANNSLLLSARKPRLRRRGSKFGRRHGVSFQTTRTESLLTRQQTRPPGPDPTGAAGQQAGELLTIAEVAEMTRLSVGTLRYWRAVGEGGPESFKLGRRVMYRRADVERWLEEAQ